MEDLKTSPKVVGAKQTRRAVNDGRALRVNMKAAFLVHTIGLLLGLG